MGDNLLPSMAFVPSIENEEGELLGLGIFSSEEKANEILREYLKKAWMIKLKSAQVVVWEIDVAGQDGAVVLRHMIPQYCPVCQRECFWVDAVNYNALCYADSCQAWIEEGTINPEQVDCGWPAVGFIAHCENIDDALNLLDRFGAKIRAGMQITAIEQMQQEEE